MKNILPKYILFSFFTISLFISQSCMIGNVGYSFKGTSIPANVYTFYLDDFENQTNTAPPTLAQTFKDGLNDRIRNETRLKNEDENPHVEFTGSITNYSVRAEAPQPGQTAAINRLTISFQIEYINNLNPDEKPMRKNFSQFADFDTSQNLIDVQDDLIDQILTEIIDEVFNWAFTNW